MFRIMPYEILIYKARMIAIDQQGQIVAHYNLTHFDKHPFQQHLAVWV
jgi:hypothetical protein